MPVIRTSSTYLAVLAASGALACGAGRTSEASGGAPSAGSPSAAAGAAGSGVGSGGHSGKGSAGGSGSAAGTGGSELGGSGGAGGADGSGALNGSSGAAAGGRTTPTVEVPANVSPGELAQLLKTASEFEAADISAAYPIKLESTLGYDPQSALGLDLIQSSSLALSEGELAKLGTNGFVISTTTKFPNFAYGYKSIYAADLPVYVSADSLLNAVHHAFDDLLMGIEWNYLIKDLDQLLQGMRDQLVQKQLEPSLRADLDLYLTLAHSLLKGTLLDAQAGADMARVKTMYDLAVAGAGHTQVTWFGTSRDEDFSQFKPRGHYTKVYELSRYFRAMMLLGRVDFRLIEAQSDGSTKFHRQQFDAALALRELLDAEGRARWAHIDEIIGGFVGEHDSMVLPDLDGLLHALGVDALESASALEDQRIQSEITSGDWGVQRIASRIIVSGAKDGRALPLDKSFALFGQRYTVDSHVFVNTTFDRVQGRMMAEPLDAAFAALGNDAALELLSPALANQSYVGGLARSRILVEAHGPAYWDGSLYTTWLSALRALSPSPATLATLPSVAKTRVFQNRVLNTQLASWAELRHDTILYAKQSYSSGATCEFPDAFVDPYPEFYARLRRIGERMGEIALTLPDTALSSGFSPTAIATWAENLQTAMGYLERMAKNQITGEPHSQELLDFINEAVRWNETSTCGQIFISNLSGWYTRLFIDSSHHREFDPTIADVHTQPTDEAGNDVGRILHAGTGHPRLMVVTAETCNGPRAYAGLASSYAEVVEENWTRLNDEEWKNRIQTGAFPDVPWMKAALGEP